MKRLLSYLFVMILMAAVCGCGGGGTPKQSGANPPGTGGTGSAAVAIQWPETTRLIPVATKSIAISITSGDRQLARKVVERPAEGGASSVQFDNLPVGTLLVHASAYPSTDAYGTLVAEGSAEISIVDDRTSTVTLTMASTIVSIDVSGSPNCLKAGESATYSAWAKDKNEWSVVVPRENLTWSSSSPSVAAVDANGKVTGIGIGTTTITVKDRESGIEGSKQIIVYKDVATSSTPKAVAASVTNKAYVAHDTSGGAISVVNGSNASVKLITNVPSSYFPTDVAVDNETNRIYVVSRYTGTDERAGLLTVINGNTDTVIVSVDTTRNPKALEVDGSTGLLYIISDSSEEYGVTVVNAATLETTKRFTPSGRGTNKFYSLAIMPSQKKLYITSNSISDSYPTAGPVYVVDLDDYSSTSHNITTDPDTQIAVDDSKNQVYLCDDGYLRTYGNSMNLIMQKYLGYSSYNHVIAVDEARNRTYLVAGYGTLTCVDWSKDAEITSYDTGYGAYEVAVCSAANRIFVTRPIYNSVSVIPGT